MKTIKYFLQKVYTAFKAYNNIYGHGKFAAELTAMMGRQINKEAARNAAIGCKGECFFCGARCVEMSQCSDTQAHNTKHHRPMAFKGTHEKHLGTNKLVNDYCLSQYNLNESRWPIEELTNPNEMHKLLQRLSNELNLETKGFNVHLEWTTGSDLDI